MVGLAGVHHRLRRQRDRIEDARRTIDAALRRRIALVPVVVDSVNRLGRRATAMVQEVAGARVRVEAADDARRMAAEHAQRGPPSMERDGLACAQRTMPSTTCSASSCRPKGGMM